MQTRAMDVDGGLEEGGAAAPGGSRKRASTEETGNEGVPTCAACSAAVPAPQCDDPSRSGWARLELPCGHVLCAGCAIARLIQSAPCPLQYPTCNERALNGMRLARPVVGGADVSAPIRRSAHR
eukprot:m.347230 g.347230  ORF g.347230 m.347230 type:complete len:124 (-) comp27919_c1_seq7:3275-3646(-)